MAPEDYTVTPCGPLGGRTAVAQHECRFLADFATTDEALAFIADHMESENYWPNVWWISDHGNCWQIDLEGNELECV